MKILTFIFSFLLFTQLGFPQWISLSGGTNAQMKSVCFTAADTGYIAAGDNYHPGMILKTIDGGTTWDTVLSGEPELYCIYFLNANTGYATNFEGDILKTINGGNSWTRYNVGTYQVLYSMHFPDASHGYAVGIFGKIVKTSDAGATWSDISYNTNDDFYSVFFTDANKGFVVSSSGKIFKTTDGGIHWFLQTSGTSSLNSVTFTNDSTGYAVGYSNNDHAGAIVKTTDAGNYWTYQSTGIDARLYSVSFPDVNTGYISGRSGTILKTTNQGATWTALASGTAKNLWSISFSCADTGYAVGDSGIILKTTNGGIVSIENKEPSTGSFTIYPLPASDKITISNSQKVHEKTLITIFNIQGQMEWYEEFQNQTIVQMDVSMLSAGIYLMKIQSKTEIEFKKLVIHKNIVVR